MSIKLTSLILSLLEELRAPLCGFLGQASSRSVLICTSAATLLASTSSTFCLLTSRMSVCLIILVRNLRGGCLRSEFRGIGTHQILGGLLVSRLIRTQVIASSPSTLAAATPLRLLIRVSVIFRVLIILLTGLVLLLLPLRLGAGASSSAKILLGRSWCCLDLR